MALGSINACSSANRYPRGYNKGGQVKPQCKKFKSTLLLRIEMIKTG